MKRQASWRALTRAFIFALSMAMLSVLSVHAQQSVKKFRIGFLDTGQTVAVPKLLTDLGYIDGQNAVFEHRSSQAQPERAAEMAADLVRSKVDVIIAFTNVNAFGAKQAARGWEADVGFIRPDETAGPTVERQLASTSYDCVVVGAGVRLLPRRLAVFEAVISAVHKAAPGAVIAFNTRPEDSAEAAARWLIEARQ